MIWKHYFGLSDEMKMNFWQYGVMRQDKRF